jgi:hypothetical protein
MDVTQVDIPTDVATGPTSSHGRGRPLSSRSCRRPAAATLRPGNYTMGSTDWPYPPRRAVYRRGPAVSMLVAGVRSAAGHPSGAADRRRRLYGHRHQPAHVCPTAAVRRPVVPEAALRAADTRLVVDSSSATHTEHRLHRATVPEAVDGQSGTVRSWPVRRRRRRGAVVH